MSAPQTASAELHPTNLERVSALTTGGFVNVWMAPGGDGSLDVFAQLHLASGATSGAAFRVNTTTAGDQGADIGPVVEGLANGRFVVSWVDQFGSWTTGGASIRAQVYDSTGVRIGGEVIVDPGADPYVDPRVSATNDGGFLVSWQDTENWSAVNPPSVGKFRLFDANGVAKTSEIKLGSNAADSEIEAATLLANGALVVGWEDHLSHALRLKLLNAAGASLSADILIAAGGDELSLASLANGSFVGTWSQSDDSVHIQRFDITGLKVGSEIIISSGASIGPNAVTGLADGGFLVAYTQPSGQTVEVYARAYDADGSARGGALKLNVTPGDSDPEVSLLTNGQAIVTWSGATQPYESLRLVEPGTPNVVIPAALATAFGNILREPFAAGADLAFENNLATQVNAGQITASQAIQQVVIRADATTSVATLAYQFFTGKTPSAAGLDYLVSPTGPNSNNLNSAYYQSFNLENRYINFSVNLGREGEGKASFQAAYGALSLFEATKKAYADIFGALATDAKAHALIDTRVDYFAAYGNDGPGGIGTKAAMVGWLLAEAVKADVGMYARANDAFLTDLADGGNFAVDLIGVYGRPEYALVV